MRVLITVLLVWLMTFPVHAAGNVLERVVTSGQVIAVMIEGIHDKNDLEELSTICLQEQISATIFSTNQFITENASLVSRSQMIGLEFGVLENTNYDWAKMSKAEIVQRLQQADTALKRVTGKANKLVRFQNHDLEQRFLQASATDDLGYTIVRGIDITEWSTNAADLSAIEKAMTTVKSGDIININLLQKNAKGTLLQLIRSAKARGYKIVTISELVSAMRVPVERKVAPKAYSVIYHINNPSQPTVFLTFDDSGNERQVGELLDVLQNNQVKSTFFLTGDWVYRNPELVRRIANAGHEIANHSFSHTSFIQLSQDEMISELQSTENAVFEVTGKPILKYFRPPYGEYNEAVGGVLKQLGYEALILWDVDTRDWAGINAASIIEEIRSHVDNGSIILFHIHGANTALALAKIIPELICRNHYRCFGISCNHH
ncbi:polysaccharide deacetylase family protein [bacterium BFN5]|nr:polysaccharide deacetylase family protein [bacterium BFN5]